MIPAASHAMPAMFVKLATTRRVHNLQTLLLHGRPPRRTCRSAHRPKRCNKQHVICITRHPNRSCSLAPQPNDFAVAPDDHYVNDAASSTKLDLMSTQTTSRASSQPHHRFTTRRRSPPKSGRTIPVRDGQNSIIGDDSTPVLVQHVNDDE